MNLEGVSLSGFFVFSRKPEGRSVKAWANLGQHSPQFGLSSDHASTAKRLLTAPVRQQSASGGAERSEERKEEAEGRGNRWQSPYAP